MSITIQDYHQENLSANRVKTRFNPYETAFLKDPLAAFDRYRDADPVHWGDNIDQAAPFARGAWYLFRHDDVMTGFRDSRLLSSLPRLYAAAQPQLRADLEADSKVMLFSDPPDHTRLRRLVNQAFTPKAIQNLEARIQQIANWLIDEVVNRGEMELIQDFAFPLPVIVITELLGLPAKDRGQFRDWSAAIMSKAQVSDASGMVPAERATLELSHYLEGVISHRRDHLGDDLISGMITAEDSGVAVLSDEELIAMIILLLIAGHETTVNLLGNGLVALLEHPEQLALLRDKPEAYMHTAVEEMLRHVGPVTMGSRYARETFELGGRTIHEGELVNLVLDAANHDPAVYPNPHRFDITRSPNRHFAFGHGIHFCLGAPLARLEAHIAFRTLLTRLQGVQLKPGAVLESGDSELRNWKSVPLVFESADTL